VREVEGHIPFRGFRTWYRDVGPEGGVPLLCLHGGPGSTHNYFEPLEELAATGRRLVFYDQLGCGESDRPEDPDLWSLELFLDELHTVRAELGLDRVHLLGTSWGAMLAIEYALGRPPGLTSLILNGSPSSSERWTEEVRGLLDELPDDVRRGLEAPKGSAEHKAAELEWEQRHFCRLDPQPEFFLRGRRKRNQEVYEIMWGPNEWTATGHLRDWDVRPRLHEIDLPVLVTSGRYDECTPALARELDEGLPNSEWVLFEQSSHTAFVEEAARYRAVLTDFLARVEGSAA
jgi:L-proline amide hydrolase